MQGAPDRAQVPAVGNQKVDIRKVRSGVGVAKCRLLAPQTPRKRSDRSEPASRAGRRVGPVVFTENRD